MEPMSSVNAGPNKVPVYAWDLRGYPVTLSVLDETAQKARLIRFGMRRHPRCGCNPLVVPSVVPGYYVF